MLQPGFRERLSAQIDPEMRTAPGLSVLNRVVIAAIVVMITLGVLETEVRFVQRYGVPMQLIEAALFGVFAAEYAARLWVAPLNPRYRASWRYALTPAALLDLLVLFSFLLPAAGVETTVFRLIRLARLLRLARLGRYSEAMNLIFSAVRLRRTELMLSTLMAFGLMLAASTLLYLVESRVQPEAFGSIPRAMWWAVATLTTVGYGDIVPVTALGRFLAAVTALCGIGIIALPTSVLAGAFADALRRARGEEAAERIRRHHD